MKRSFFLRVLILGVVGVFLAGGFYIEAMDDGGLADPASGDTLWQVAGRTFKKARANQFKLNSIESAMTTQSAVDAIDSTLYTNQSKLDSIESSMAAQSSIDVLDSKIDLLDSKIDLLDSQSCCESTVIMGTTTITASGPYCLTQDIQGTITINADNVTLDLNCYSLTDASYGIIINNNRSDVSIKNGTVGGGTTANQIGISVGSGCSRIAVKNVAVVGCELVALDFGGTNSSPIKTIDIDRCRVEKSEIGLQIDNVQGGLIKQCAMSFNLIGIYFDESETLIVDNCSSFNNEGAGFELKLSSNNCFRNCKAIKNGEIGSDNAFGFVSSNGSCNMFQGCIAQDTKANSTSSSKMAAGFALIGTEQKSIISHCTSKSTTAAAGGSSQAKSFGIYLEGTTQGCIIRDSLISGTTGDAGGVGCDADENDNLIIRNIGYENDTNFGSNITNVHTSGLGTDPKGLDNISL